MDQMPPQKSKDDQYVTIPYFLYEAMARAYYLREQNSDLPVMDTPSASQIPLEENMGGTVGGDLNLKDLYFNPNDIPMNWKPGGVAAKEQLNVPSDIQATQEQD